MTRTVFVAAVLLVAAVSAVAASASSSQPAASAATIRTYLMPDLSLKSVLSPSLLPKAAVPAAESVAANPRQGFCRCSCGQPCTSSADCGGASCDKFITCCERKPQGGAAEWFTLGFELSSHEKSGVDAIIQSDCK